MLQNSLLNPENIAIIGASENQSKPGGKVIFNLISGGFKGKIYGVNPKVISIEGVEHIAKVDLLPKVDLAILSIPAALCVETVNTLAQAGTKGFIIYSAGFAEAGETGIKLENQLIAIAEKFNAQIIGPNCIGIINGNYKGVFTTPVPDYNADGCELISSSGATAVFIMEAAHAVGLNFSNIYSIGNAGQTGVEEILEHMDTTYDPERSPKVKLLYLENIKNPFKFLKHASSLVRKGCHLAAIKSGYSEAGSRAASSHTGAIATSDTLIRALFKKAAIVYCNSREELINVAAVWQENKAIGKNIAIITHAGGSAVMLTDVLSVNGVNVPPIDEDKGKVLLEKLHPGSSVSNPIDFLATGTADQLAEIIDFCDELEEIDAMVVVFGSPGLFNVRDVYEVLHQKLQSCKKAIFPVLPSLVNAGKEIQEFIDKGHVNFPDEVVLGKALASAANLDVPAYGKYDLAEMDYSKIRDIIVESKSGYLDTNIVRELLTAAGIEMVKEREFYDEKSLAAVNKSMEFPLVMKVLGPIHKTDVGGVSLNINSQEFLKKEFNRMMKISGAKGVLIQEMKKGEEFFAGAVKKGNFGHLILCGMGGIYVEIIKDVANGLAPLSKREAEKMIQSLKTYPIIQGYRGKPGINEAAFADVIVRLASLVHLAPEIEEIDMNPLIGNERELVVVDARIRLS
ncbi:acetate--CoA ligase family protein [Marivirga harenae]|uniref:acetate--CoA ligase family protein n=1 Tax=Marivirga harenae TaxID=2010992 RepID=UPI0026DFACFB|nr:acetate--CoA ligase [Marivirga harenae]WKV12944.1 acetate--CoA ligase family protein [Marivirga harenae]